MAVCNDNKRRSPITYSTTFRSVKCVVDMINSVEDFIGPIKVFWMLCMHCSEFPKTAVWLTGAEEKEKNFILIKIMASLGKTTSSSCMHITYCIYMNLGH